MARPAWALRTFWDRFRKRGVSGGYIAMEMAENHLAVRERRRRHRLSREASHSLECVRMDRV